MRLSAQSFPWRRTRSTWIYAFIFLISFVLLFLGMDRGFDFYDEGLNLVGAMRVAAGEVPHRDFYANYGPGQFYMLAWLFDLFGPSIFVERMYDLVLRSAIVTVTYGITARYTRRSLAFSTTAVCWLWLFSTGLPTIAYPIIPVLLLALLSSALLLPLSRGPGYRWHSFFAGALAGLAGLFRYDVGCALAIVQLGFILIVRSTPRQQAGARWTMLGRYGLGVAAVFLPPALLYMWVAPLQPFIHDIILYPAKYYGRARRVPFPVIHWRSLENLAVYLPVAVAIACLYTVVTGGSRRDAPADGTAVTEREHRAFLVLFGLLAAVFYFKGVVRISVAQMLLSIVLTAVTLAVLVDYTTGRRRRLGSVVLAMMAISIFSATWSALKEVRVLYRSQQSVLQEILSGPRSTQAEQEGCQVSLRLHTGLCFLVDSSHADAISYLAQHSKPSERIFIGLSRHDRLVMNDLLTYFVSDRLPATRWAHFDPDLQTRADVQSQMIRELDAQRVRYVILESQFDAQVQPWNDSSKSSGVTLLDDYIRKDYRLVETYGPISIWLRNGEGV